MAKIIKNLNKAEITEQEIYNNPLLFRLLSDAAYSGIIIYNKRRLLYVNPYLIKLLGYSKEELLSFNSAEWVDPDYRELMLNRASNRLSGNKDEIHYEFKACPKNGANLWFDISINTFDYNGNNLGIATLYNTTERKVIEDKLKESEKVFKTLAGTTSSLIIIYNKEKLLYVNPACIKSTGYTEEELLNMSYIELIDPEFKEIIKERSLIRLNKENVVSHYEFKINTKNNEELWVDFDTRIIEYKGLISGMAIMTDITERKANVNKLKKAAEDWENTFNSIEDILFIIDTDYRILRANNSFSILYNLKQNEVIGKKCYEIVNEKDELCTYCVALRSLKDKKSHIEDWEDPKLGRYFQVSISPLFDDKENVIGFVHLARDISELKFAEKEIMESVKMKSEFISTVSHELRTPLAAIKEGIDLLSTDLSLSVNNDQKSVLEIIQRNINRLSKHINNVLDFQKLESGNIQFNVTKNDLNDTLLEVHSLMGPIAKEKGLELILDLDKSIPMIMFDRDRILQVITNLVNNSIKYTTNGRILMVSLNCTNYVKVTLNDTGVGIKRDEINDIFQSFTQVGEWKNRKGGTGLGLSICKEIIEHHGGRIWVESEYGKGTSFQFILPI